MGTETIRFESGPGSGVAVTTNAGRDLTPPSGTVAPHAARIRATGRINWGNNFHGSLEEWYYVTRNNAWDPEYWVLWIGDDGSQYDDNCPRIMPGAWVRISEIEELDSEAAEDRRRARALAARVLLYSWIRSDHGCDEAMSPLIATGSEVISKSEIRRVIEIAGGGVPVTGLIGESSTAAAPKRRTGRRRGPLK